MRLGTIPDMRVATLPDGTEITTSWEMEATPEGVSDGEARFRVDVTAASVCCACGWFLTGLAVSDIARSIRLHAWTHS